tara:strand:+ start:1237 stop:1686 length:450 start_codon:yes stop_codon:yes gene_type:complete
MAIARGAGTEIIRNVWFHDMDNTEQELIVGVQHHIYTVINITIHCRALSSSSNTMIIAINPGWDAKAGASSTIRILNQSIPVNNTFVFNDRFSFNGTMPTGISGSMNTTTEQDAIADQGSATAQKLTAVSSNASDNFVVGITYIDQNNA